MSSHLASHSSSVLGPPLRAAASCRALPTAARRAAVVLLAAAVVLMHAVTGTGPAHGDAPERAATVAAAEATGTGHTPAAGSTEDSPVESHHGCPDCDGAHGASLGHLCLAVVCGLLLAGALSWTHRRHRLPALDLDVRWLGRLVTAGGQAVLGVPPWAHLSLAQLSVLRV
ncbi:hypothetical protein [uncultured Pseudokineococcus sp.]|uniref:hypothetical protein n=1 Tax=uncultured Pseudokineococcus sp. TaxID=1642928 RepID=UPI002631EEB3|nr:hypothetical protein [uncultured Pseudokineococcus sp.]